MVTITDRFVFTLTIWVSCVVINLSTSDARHSYSSDLIILSSTAEGESAQDRIWSFKNEFNVELKNGTLYLLNHPVKKGEYDIVALDSINLKEDLDALGIRQNVSEKDLKDKIYVSVVGKEEDVFLVFKNSILKVATALYSRPRKRTDEQIDQDESQIKVGMTFDEAREKLRIAGYTETLKDFVEKHSMPTSGVGSRDSSEICTYVGSILTSSNGSIVATTPTTLMIITPTYKRSATYKEMFGIESNLQRPIVSAGVGPHLAELRDATIVDEKSRPVKLVINLSEFEISGVLEENK